MIQWSGSVVWIMDDREEPEAAHVARCEPDGADDIWRREPPDCSRIVHPPVHLSHRHRAEGDMWRREPSDCSRRTVLLQGGGARWSNIVGQTIGGQTIVGQICVAACIDPRRQFTIG